MNLIERIEHSGFIADSQMLQQLAFEHTIAIDFGKRSRSTYMQILVARAQQEGNIDEVYAKTYPDIRAGIEKAGYTGKEADSKANFARSAMSTLRGFIKRGGDIMELNPATVTKAQLQPPRIAAPKLQRTENRLILSLRALAKTDEDAALEELESLMAQLKALRKEWRPRVVSHQLERQQPTAH